MGIIRKLFRRSAGTSADTLYFASPSAAIEYASFYCDNAPHAGRFLPAIVEDVTVLDGKPIFYLIKIPTDRGFDLIVADSHSDDAQFQAGDLVAFWCLGQKDTQGKPIGLIAKKLLPEMHIKHGWKTAD